METKSILPLIEQLEGDIDDLEEALQPLLKDPLSVVTQKLPVLDKAKLYVLVTYAIESLIFCEFPRKPYPKGSDCMLTIPPSLSPAQWR